MSRRFRLYSWVVAVSDVLIGSVFLTAHPAMTTPAWYYVFLFIPWQAWSAIFLTIGVALAGAIGTKNSATVRKVASFSVVALLVWAVEFALIIPAVLKGRDVSFMGMILVGTLAALELLYLGMPASKWLDQAEEGVPHEYLIEI